MKTSKTLAQSLAAIEALDLEPTKFKAMRSDDGYGWSAQEADRAAAAYKRYLVLLAKYPEITLVPDRDTDRFWHTHILDTRKYAADCEAVFGEFLHHYPYLGLRGEDDARRAGEAFATMQQLLAKEFSTPERATSGEGAVLATSWCGKEPPPAKQAAWCGKEPPPVMQAAWCGKEPPPVMQAAWCGKEPPPVMQAAWCGKEPPPAMQAAWCGKEPPPVMQAAWCGKEPPPAKEGDRLVA